MGSQMSWKSDIKYIQNKVSKSTAILKRARQVLDNRALHILYCSLVLPYLTYCVEVWGNNYKTSLQSLVTLQKRAIRYVHKVSYLDHTNLLFLKSKLIKFSDLVVFQTLQLVFKAKIKLLPINIQKLFGDGKEYIISDLHLQNK